LKKPFHKWTFCKHLYILFKNKLAKVNNCRGLLLSFARFALYGATADEDAMAWLILKRLFNMILKLLSVFRCSPFKHFFKAKPIFVKPRYGFNNMTMRPD